MEIPIVQMESGYTVAFKGTGFLFTVLSFILGVAEPKWRKRKWKPWHLATASKKVRKDGEEGWLLIEALTPVVDERFHSLEELISVAKSYKWLDKPPSRYKIGQFKKIYLGFPYDATAYIGVVFSYICRKLLRLRWRVFDTEHMCWETNSIFMRFMGKPYQPMWEYPMIHAIMGKLEST